MIDLIIEEDGSTSEMKYTNWAAGQPVVDRSNKLCVALDMKSKLWRTDTCDGYASVLCAGMFKVVVVPWHNG